MGKNIILIKNIVACSRNTNKNHTQTSKNSVDAEIFSAVMYNQSEGIHCLNVSVMHVAIKSINNLS